MSNMIYKMTNKKATITAIVAGFAFAAAAQEVANVQASAPVAPTAAPVVEDSVYNRIYAEMTKHTSRIAGSEALDSSFAVLEKELKAAGLEPKYQTFDTLVQKTEKCSLTYNGEPVPGILMVDNGPAPFVLDKPIDAPLVYVKSGSIEDLDGVNVDGAIAVVDATLPTVRLSDTFMRGAKAVILVGDESLNQWQLLKCSFETITLVPRLYIDRKAASAAGLLEADGSKNAVIDAKAVLVDTKAKNLWVELPSKENWTVGLNLPQTVVLSARMDTYGFTPDFSPDNRYAANAALLADVVCELAKNGPYNRKIIAVFYGSHYAGQEGARFFYHAVDMAKNLADGSENNLLQRKINYAAEMKYNDELINTIAAGNIILQRTPVATDLQLRLRDAIIGIVGEQRSMLAGASLELKRLRDEDPEGNAARIAELENLEITCKAKRAMWNELRRQLNRHEFTDAEPLTEAYNELVRLGLNKTDSAIEEFGVVYNELIGQIDNRLKLRKIELENHIKNNLTWIDLSNEFIYEDAKGQKGTHAIVGHFDFDFASASEPWVFSVINASGLYHFESIDIGMYLRHLGVLNHIYYGSELRNDDGSLKEKIPGLSEGKDWAAKLYKPAVANPTFKPFSLSVPNQRVAPSAVATGVGTPGFQLMTVGDSLAHDALPFADSYDLSDLKDQMVCLCTEFANTERLSISAPFKGEKMESRFLYAAKDEKSWTGVNFIDYARGSTDPDGVPENAILQFTGIEQTDPQVGISKLARTRILHNGFVYMPMVSQSTAISSWRASSIGIGYNKDTGAFERISVEGESAGIINTPIHLFYAYGGLTFNNGYAPDPVGGAMYEAQTLIASKDAKHKTSANYGVGQLKKNEFFADRPDKIKRIGSNGDMVLGSVALTNDSVSATERMKAAMGEGISMDQKEMLNFDGIAQGANDAFVLNEARLDTLRKRNIIRDDLEKLHADAKDHLDEARASSDAKMWSKARAHQVFATCIESRVYNPLRSVTEDLVQAVVLLLLLNIPFAFAMERLICGFTSIYKQLLGFCLFFIITFGILFFTHPAFALASAPTIIFLAFVIILLSVITTAIMMGKIKQEIKAMQGLSSTVHGMESENSTTLSAILIGIAGMRNRPLKTFLTCTTVVLLTFTILVFASFTSQQGVVESYLGRGQGENRIELHRLSLLGIDRTLIESIDAIKGEDFHIFCRGGVFPNPTKATDVGIAPLAPERMIYAPRTEKIASINAIMGFDKGEFEHSKALAEVCPKFATVSGTAFSPIYLPESLVKELDIVEGDEIRINGISFTFTGTFETMKLQNISTLDSQKILLPDFQSTIKNAGGTGSGVSSVESLEQMQVGTFEWFNAESVALANIDDLNALFGFNNYVNFMVLYPRSDSIDIEAEARALAPVFTGTVHVKSSEGVRYMFFTQAVEGSGFSDVIIPLLLGGLIIFSSLMGSIVDREREIFTYSALGLSPPNVGALFFAESAVYSVIGGMGGYLLSQIVAKVFTILGRMGLMTPPEMNFSSLTSVCTILIVMAVVMLSTIFPALRASKSANPGVARKWSMPSPEGDLLKFVFPFTVSEVDFSGILSFIREHFNNHSDATLGAFAARNVKLFKIPGAKGGKDALGIEADVSLAPFDLGIFQKFRMYSSEFEIKGIDEVVVEITRQGGTPNAWMRSNRGFADELRKQFLLWRSLPIETIEHYRAQTEATLEGKDAE